MSWRESSDPRCPECGGKIAATASYCMHCEADLDGDTGQDSVLSDDEFDQSETGETSSSGWDRSESISGESESGATESSGRSLSAATGKGDRHKVEALAHSLTSFLWTDVPDSEGVPDSEFTAPLWMRLPVGIFAGLFVYVVFLVDVALFLGILPGVISGLLAFFGFVGIMWWLVRKPLPSDIVGDASYGIALLLLAIPVLFFVNEMLKILVGVSGSSPGETVVATVVLGVVVMVPTGFLLIVGFAGNRYARSKLDRIAEKSADRSL